MSDEQLILIALLGAGAAAGSLALTRRDIELPSVWYRLTWPREVDGDGVVAFFAKDRVFAREAVVVSAASVVAAEHLAGFAGIQSRKALHLIQLVDEPRFVGRGGDGLEQDGQQKANGGL